MLLIKVENLSTVLKKRSNLTENDLLQQLAYKEVFNKKNLYIVNPEVNKFYKIDYQKNNESSISNFVEEE
ncbi:MAG: hypothetical protein LBH55_03545 [Mycoplasmataceae bacterium]|jgi:poly(3-hydroxyalkanoate) synthetase|nr:hypothetical protein [Mycoplasmataceae bacterium]